MYLIGDVTGDFILSAKSAALWVAVACVFGATAVAAQDTTVQVGPAMSAPSPNDPGTPPTELAKPKLVPNGTAIVVRIVDLVSTRTASREDVFNLVLAEPVLLDGEIVIPAGTPGKGQVVDAGKPGMAGKPGKLVLAGRYLEFEGRQIPIRGLKMALTAKNNTNAALAVTVAAGVFGLAVTGGHMEVQPGTLANAKLAADFSPAQPSVSAPSNSMSEEAPSPVSE